MSQLITPTAAQLLGFAGQNLNASADRAMESAKIRSGAQIAQAQIESQQTIAEAQLEAEQHIEEQKQQGFDKQREAESANVQAELGSREKVADKQVQSQQQLQEQAQEFEAEQAEQQRKHDDTMFRRRTAVTGQLQEALLQHQEAVQIGNREAATEARKRASGLIEKRDEDDAQLQELRTAQTMLDDELGMNGEVIASVRRHTIDLQSALDAKEKLLTSSAAKAVSEATRKGAGGGLRDALRKGGAPVPGEAYESHRLVELTMDELGRSGVFAHVKGPDGKDASAEARRRVEDLMKALVLQASPSTDRSPEVAAAVAARTKTAMATARQLVDDETLEGVLKTVSSQFDGMSSGSKATDQQAIAAAGGKDTLQTKPAERERLYGAYDALASMYTRASAAGLSSAHGKGKRLTDIHVNALAAVRKLDPARFTQILSEAASVMSSSEYDEFKRSIAEAEQTVTKRIETARKVKEIEGHRRSIDRDIGRITGEQASDDASRRQTEANTKLHGSLQSIFQNLDPATAP